VRQVGQLLALEDWTEIAEKTGTTFVRSNYVWLGLVPAAAKILQDFGDRVVLSIGGESIELVTQLPFSWQLFFWGAVAFVVAHVTYWLSCPELIRKFRDFEDYERRGYSPRRIFDAYDQYRRPNDDLAGRIGRAERPGTLVVGEGNRRQLVADVFNYLVESDEKAHPAARFVCTWALRAGFACFAVVFIQNLVFVLRFTFSTDRSLQAKKLLWLINGQVDRRPFAPRARCGFCCGEGFSRSGKYWKNNE
jgi:hypothetical protein